MGINTLPLPDPDKIEGGNGLFDVNNIDDPYDDSLFFEEELNWNCCIEIQNFY